LASLFVYITGMTSVYDNLYVGGGRNCFHSKRAYWLVRCGVSLGNAKACAIHI